MRVRSSTSVGQVQARVKALGEYVALRFVRMVGLVRDAPRAKGKGVT